MEENKVKIFLNEQKEEPIHDKTIDEYEQLINEELCISNNLLGNFVDGKYIISKNIKEELVMGKKVQVDSDENKIYAVLKTKFEAYHLELVFEKFGEDKSIAKFYLVEKIKEYGEELKSFIAEFVSEDRPDFKQTAREAFNIFIVNGELIDENEDILENINKRLEDFKKLKTSDMEFVTEMYSEIYIEKMLKILEKMGPRGQKIIKEYKEKLHKKGLDKKEVIPNLYTKMKKCLDQAIKENGGLKPLVAIAPEIRKIVTEYVEPIRTYREIARQEPIAASVPANVKPEKSASKSAPKKPEKKEDKKKGGKSGDKGGNKGGKDKGGKKDDKKKRAIPDLKRIKEKQNAQKDEIKPSQPVKPERTQILKPATTPGKKPAVFLKLFERGEDSEKLAGSAQVTIIETSSGDSREKPSIVLQEKQKEKSVELEYIESTFEKQKEKSGELENKEVSFEKQKTDISLEK